MSSAYFPGFSQLPSWLTTSQDLFRKNVRVSSFIFPANGDALRRKTHTWFQQATNGKFGASPYLDFEMVTFLNAFGHKGRPPGTRLDPSGQLQGPHAELRNESNKPMGVFKYHALHLTFLVKAQDGQVYAFSPYNFMDDTTALTYARETFGQSTLLTDFYYPSDEVSGEGNDFYLRMEADDVTDQTTGLSVRDKVLLLEIQPAPRSAHARIAPSIRLGNREGQVKIPHFLQKRLQNRQHTLFKKNHLNHLFMAGTGREKVISLRQFRGSPLSDRAVLKSLVTYIPGKSRVHHYRWIPHSFELHLPPTSRIVQTHFPLKRTLGLQQVNTSVAAFEATLDFQYLPLKTLWSAF